MADEKDWSAQRWAIEISKLWRSVAGAARFPVDVEAIAPDLSAARFPSDPVKAIRVGDHLQRKRRWSRSQEIHDFPRIWPLPASSDEVAQRHRMRRTGRHTARGKRHREGGRRVRRRVAHAAR